MFSNGYNIKYLKQVSTLNGKDSDGEKDLTRTIFGAY